MASRYDKEEKVVRAKATHLLSAPTARLGCLLGEDAIYAGARMHESERRKIVRRLVRRDQEGTYVDLDEDGVADYSFGSSARPGGSLSVILTSAVTSTLFSPPLPTTGS